MRLRYVSLYDLLKVEEQLKERKMSFEDMDKKGLEIQQRIFGKRNKNNYLDRIDEKYEKEKP